MSEKIMICTDQTPAAIGPYSQAVKGNDTVFISGQIPLDPATMEVVSDDFEAQTEQVFKNLSAVAKAAGGSLADATKLNIYLTDLSNFALLNEVMMRYFDAPYPARAAIGVSELPKGVAVEVEGVLVI